VSRKHDSAGRALADRLVSDSDAIVALAVVGVSGLGIAIADPDIRESISSAAIHIAIANAILACVMSGIVLLLRSWEQDLRSESEPTAKAVRYSRNLHPAHLIIIWVTSAQAIAFMILVG
jgi:hypothetical protein